MDGGLFSPQLSLASVAADAGGPFSTAAHSRRSGRTDGENIFYLPSWRTTRLRTLSLERRVNDDCPLLSFPARPKRRLPRLQFLLPERRGGMKLNASCVDILHWPALICLGRRTMYYEGRNPRTLTGSISQESSRKGPSFVLFLLRSLIPSSSNANVEREREKRLFSVSRVVSDYTRSGGGGGGEIGRGRRRERERPKSHMLMSEAEQRLPLRHI